MGENDIILGGRLHSVASGNIVAGANAILDDGFQKKQAEINAAIYEKTYEPSLYSGLGRKILDKNLVDTGSGTVNILTQAMISTANTVYVIRYDFDLNGATITLPDGCMLEFDGGSLKNGVLSGTLLTTKGFVDISSFGVVYNSSEAATQNRGALGILSGITNEVRLKVSGEVWLRGNSVSLKYLNLDGGANTIHIDSFDGFVATYGVSVRNCRIVTEEWVTYKSWLVAVSNVVKPIDILFENNYCRGSMRVISAYNIADGVTEDGTFVSTNYDVCINSLIVRGNVFEEICCGNGNNTIFMFSDTNVKSVIIDNNNIHNFFAQFFGFGITNGSVYQDYIDDFYQHVGRNICVTNNNVTNDLDFKPWTKINRTPAYFTFVLAEYGKVVYSDNIIINIIGNDNNYPVYDAYLSVEILTYRNNYIKNVVNLSGNYNAILKSKSGRGKLVRAYTGNKYILEDLSSEFDVDMTALNCYLVNTGAAHEEFAFENNYLDFYSFTFNSNYALRTRRLLFYNNFIKVNIAKAYGEHCLLPFYSNLEYAFIKDNTISVASIVSIFPVLFGSEESNSANVLVSGNRLTNMYLFSDKDARTSYPTGKCTNNTCIIDGAVIPSPDRTYIYKNNSAGSTVAISENEFILNGTPPTNFHQALTLYPTPLKEVKIKRASRGYVYLNAGLKKDVHLIVEIRDTNKLLVGLFEVLITSTGLITGFNSNGVYVQNASSTTNLYNFAKRSDIADFTGTYVSVNSSKQVLLYSLPYEFYVTSYVYDDSKLTLYLKRGTSVKRPTSFLTIRDGGVTYIDTTLNKPIIWNGTNWVDGVGTTITYPITYTLTNVTASNAQQPDAGAQYTTVLTANEGYTLPSSITVKMGSSTLTANTDYTYDSTTGEVVVLGSGGAGGVTAELKITATGVEIPDVPDTPEEETLGGEGE